MAKKQPQEKKEEERLLAVPEEDKNDQKAQEETLDVIIDEVDFNELLEFERAIRNTEAQLEKVSGTIFRLTQDQGTIYAHERSLNAQIEVKRKELNKRYKLDEQRSWKVDLNTRKIVYNQ